MNVIRAGFLARRGGENAVNFRPTIPRLALAALLAAAGPATAFASVPGQEAASVAEIRGQLSFWLGFHDRPSSETALGFRYIPSFSIKKEWAGGLALDAEASANIHASVQAASFGSTERSGAAKPYRAWVRFSTPRFEARLGLQKINFGSAQLLRPLMWFDRIDPNDPLQLTDGVTGLLLKYTFADNSNVWAWGLYGNGDPKGWETVPTRRGDPEFGFRLQSPLLSGEAALTFHHRRIDPSRSLLPLAPGESESVGEDRVGFDGKWDAGVGLWVEAVLVRQDLLVSPLRYQRMVNAGLDYTFGLGNGLRVMAEHLLFEISREALGAGTRRNLTAMTADYPLGILDRVRALVFHDWTSGDWYRLLTWQRTTDAWSLYLIGFWNPDRYQIYANRPETNLFAGKGIQFTAVYNH